MKMHRLIGSEIEVWIPRKSKKVHISKMDLYEPKLIITEPFCSQIELVHGIPNNMRATEQTGRESKVKQEFYKWKDENAL